MRVCYFWLDNVQSKDHIFSNLAQQINDHNTITGKLWYPSLKLLTIISTFVLKSISIHLLTLQCCNQIFRTVHNSNRQLTVCTNIVQLCVLPPSAQTQRISRVLPGGHVGAI